MILKGFTVTAIYDERFSNIKGNAVPTLFIGVLEYSVGELREGGCETVIACDFTKRGWSLGKALRSH